MKSMWIREIFLGFLGICAGLTVAGGFVALITLLGVIPRLASETKTMKRAILYENFLILGVVLGNIVSLYSPRLPFGFPFLILFGLFAGVFVGCLAMALAETINTFPIFFRRLSMRKGAPFIVISLAIGKGIGSLVQLYFGR